MEKTLWELAEEMRMVGESPLVDSDAAAMARACADSLKQWAREKAKEWGRRNKAGRPVVLAYECIEDLGVPEEKP